MMNKYVVDACAIIAYFRDETGSDKFEALLKNPDNQFLMHAINHCHLVKHFLSFPT